jgi:amidophosphoribosyltransferase
MRNEVRRLYDGLSADEISAKIAELVSPTDLDWKGEVIVIYQTIENLNRALPHATGDWYFTGHYPTPGGVRVVNQAFVNYFEKSDARSY